MSVKPITPDEIRGMSCGTMPDKMIQAVNDLLQERRNQVIRIKITRSEICERFNQYVAGSYTTIEMETKGWFSDMIYQFSIAGWKVDVCGTAFVFSERGYLD